MKIAEAIIETARQTDMQIELSPDMTNELDWRFAALQSRLAEHPSVTVTYFLPDRKKNGGSYRVHSGTLSGFREQKRILVFQDGTRINLADVVSLEGDLDSEFLVSRLNGILTAKVIETVH